MTDATPYPLPRQTRQTDVLVGNGGTVYGPFDFKVFDVEDVEVWFKAAADEAFQLVGATVEKVGGDALAYFTVTFPAEIDASTAFFVRSARVHERSVGVKSGSRLDATALEKELSKIATVVQELRRDLGRALMAQVGTVAFRIDDGLAEGDFLTLDAAGVIRGRPGGAVGRPVFLAETGADAINALGGSGGLIVDAMIASLGAEKLTGTIDPARIPVLPNNVQVMSSGGIADLTILQQAQVVQGAIVTTTDGRRWVYLGAGSKLDEASYIALADITPEWSAISGKPAFGSAALDESGDFATAAQGVKADTALAALDTKFDKAGGTISGVTQLNSDLRAYTQVFFGYGLATGGQSVLGGFRSGNNWIFAGNNGEGGWNWGAALEWSAASGAWNFVGRPTFAGQPLATLAEVGSGSGVAGVSSFNGRTGTVAPQSGDYNSTQITHAAETVSAALSRAEVKTPWLTPEMFGAVGDGSTDDLAAFNAMKAAIGSRGGKIVLPPKKYYLSADFTIDKNSVHIDGTPTRDDSNGTVLRFAANGGLKFDGADACRCAGFRISSVGGSTDTSLHKALLALGNLSGSVRGGCAGNVFDQIDVEGGARSLYLGKTLSTRFHNSRFLGSTETSSEVVLMCGGADADFGVDNAEFYGCNLGSFDSDTSRNVVRLDGKAHGVKFFGCPIVYGKTGIVTDRSNGAWSWPKFLLVVGGGWENGHENALRAIYGDDFRIVGAYASTDGDQDGIYMASSFSGQIIVGSSTIRGNGRSGIRVLGGRLIANGGSYVNNGGNGNGDGDGIYIGSGVTRYVLVGNFMGAAIDGINNQRYGVYNGAGSATGKIGENMMIDNASGDIGGTSSGTGITDNL